MMRWLRKHRLLAAFALQVVTAVCIYAQGSVGAATTSQGFIAGAVVVVGIGVVTILTLTGKIEDRIDKRVDIRMKDDDSVFGQHRKDAFAHESMRREIMNEFRDDFERIRTEIAKQGTRHGEEMDRLTEIVKPVLEQNGRMIEYIAAQMRREPKHHDQDRTTHNS